MPRPIITSTILASITEMIDYIWAASNYHPHSLYNEISWLSNTFYSMSPALNQEYADYIFHQIRVLYDMAQRLEYYCQNQLYNGYVPPSFDP